MISPCPRCGVPGPVVVSSDGALPPDLVMAEVARLREALEQIAARHVGPKHHPAAYAAAQDIMSRIARAALGRTL